MSFSDSINLRQWFPFLETFRVYRREYLRPDFVASLTVALLEVPQAMAYAMIAGLPPVYGLYTSVITGFVSALLNDSQHTICGPNNAISLMVASVWLTVADPSIRENPAVLVGVLTFLVGVIQVIFGFLKVGNISQFISRSVLVGFVSAAGLLIVVSQLPVLLGIELPSEKYFVGQLWSLSTHLGEMNPYTVAVGLAAMLIVHVGSRWLPRWPTALVAVAALAAGVRFLDLDSEGVILIGSIPAGFPAFSMPWITTGHVAELAGKALAIAILGCIATLSISKGLNLSTGRRANSNQDFLGMGIAHIIGAFFRCMPGCGSFTRSALNHRAGARTRLAGILSAIWVGVILLALGPLARFIPKASLAGLLIVLGFSLIRWTDIQVALRSTKSDAAVLIVTFVCTLMLHLDTAIYVGVISSLVLFLRKASAPHLVEYDLEGDSFREIQNSAERSNPAISIIHVEGELFFGAAELFEDEVRRLADDRNVRVVILRMKNARHLDATAVMALKGLWKFLRDDGRLLLISGASADVMRVLRSSGLLREIGEENAFPAEENLTAATRKALLRAQEFIGGETKPEVRVFYDQTRASQQKSNPGA